ncbi:MAG TPA: DinB family protein [Dehalococcoidia bacterium]|nr:DinB family protein [Dehalococcoidia bacterium]
MRLEEKDSAGWAMKALREAGGTLLGEFSGIDDATLRHRPAEDELSLKEIAAHLRDAEELALLQLTAAIEQPDRKLPHWDIDVLPFERDYRGMDLRRFLSEWRGLRNETTSMLWMLREWEWRKPLNHPYRGEITIETIARELAQHDLEHLWQVRCLKFDLVGATADFAEDDF